MWQWGTGWFDFSQISYLAGLGNFRFFVEGTVIPEPTTGSLLAIAMLSLNGFVRKFSGNHLRATTRASAMEWTGFEVANKCE
jgi:hypothetical protein